VEHVRVTLITTDPARVHGVVRYVEDEARKRIDDEPGSRGAAFFVEPDLGELLLDTFWVSGDAMREGERAEAPLRKEVERLAESTVTVEPYEVALATRQVRPKSGAGARVTRVEMNPKRINDAFELYEDATLPWLTETDGFCSALFLVHRGTGRAMTEAIWRDADALAASRSADATARADAAAATEAAVRSLQEYRLEQTTAHL
jgi:hypothetical protein